MGIAEGTFSEQQFPTYRRPDLIPNNGRVSLNARYAFEQRRGEEA